LKLIVGLGNPGPEYSETRHNVGFKVAEELARRHQVKFRKSSKWKALIAKIPDVGDGVVLAQPATFMNLSGWAVRGLVSFHKIALADLLVVVDDADLALGRLRIRVAGSAGGHNGLKSIIASVGSNEFIRVRLGVKPEYPLEDMAEYVLHTMRKPEREIAAQMAADAAEAVELIVAEGADKAMAKYNRRVESDEEDSE
jgi:PTH1 family peptidyl-tRNA hydrolase